MINEGIESIISSSNRKDESDDAEPFLGIQNISYQNSKRVLTNFYGETESHQYEPDENEIWRQHQLQRHLKERGNFFTNAKSREVRRWILTFIIGLLCGIVATFVTYFTKVLTKMKFMVFNYILEQEKLDEIPFGSAFIALCIFNVIFGMLAWFSVYLEPLAAGSGIPEIKCFLNGLNIPRIVRIKTLLCKIIGLIFASSSGLPLGKEGPMVHAGAVIAAGVSQGKSNTLGYDTAFSKYQDFRNDKEKRDFVACGAAAGVAAAFGAPVGGVLFSLEEGASYWSTKLTWRSFFCGMVTVFTLMVLNTAKQMFGHSDNTAMFSFGEFFSLEQEKSNFSVWELSVFIVIGCMGGIIGSIFNTFNDKLSKLRSSAMLSRNQRLIEVIFLVVIMTTLSFVLPLIWNHCTPLPLESDEWGDQERHLIKQLHPFYCNKKTHYNELASLYLTDSDTAIKQLFHFREKGDNNDSTFSSSVLFFFFLPYLILACLTCGAAVPAGMFVPSLLSGAAFGRLVGHLLHKIDNTRGTFADSGTYALLGAAAITGGITRMTISLTVMMLEGTGDMQYVLPLMLTLMSARLLGNVFSEGLYDLHIHCSNLDYLDEDERVSKFAPLQDLSASDIMSPNPIYLRSTMRVGKVLDILASCNHHCFPILDDDENDKDVLIGTVLRKVLCSLIKHQAFGPPLPAINNSMDISPRRISPLVSWSTLESIYPRYPDSASLNVSQKDRQAWLDLRPYIDRAAYTINENASLQRTYRMFRTLGLRHLCVVNNHGKIQGIITRADLVPSHVESKAKLQEKKNSSMHSLLPLKVGNEEFGRTKPMKIGSSIPTTNKNY